MCRWFNSALGHQPFDALLIVSAGRSDHVSGSLPIALDPAIQPCPESPRRRPRQAAKAQIDGDRPCVFADHLYLLACRGTGLRSFSERNLSGGRRPSPNRRGLHRDCILIGPIVQDPRRCLAAGQQCQPDQRRNSTHSLSSLASAFLPQWRVRRHPTSTARAPRQCYQSPRSRPLQLVSTPSRHKPPHIRLKRRRCPGKPAAGPVRFPIGP